MLSPLIRFDVATRYCICFVPLTTLFPSRSTCTIKLTLLFFSFVYFFATPLLYCTVMLYNTGASNSCANSEGIVSHLLMIYWSDDGFYFP